MTPNQRTDAWRIGVDTGGTFTDLLLVDPSGLLRTSCKVLSTPDDPGRAVLEGIDRLLARAAASGAIGGDDLQTVRDGLSVVHGSTVATNALLEAKADDAALVTTMGFEDVLLLARQHRPSLYALAPVLTPPPISRERVVGLCERMAYDGRPITPPTQAEIDRVVAALRELDPPSIAICLLHSYANDAHERRLAEALREAFTDVHLTVSSELLPELREYERAATCAVNAAVAPTMSRYIGGLDRALGEGRLRIMASGGGTLPPRVVCDRPVETVLSGPAGGVVGAWTMAARAGVSRMIGLDMGGTSTDVALCEDGPTRTTESRINDLPIRLPMIDIHTVGAGGGSIAYVDGGGALRVGPESAGADPGPACYGQQRAEAYQPTVTDAHAVLGHLRHGRALGESMSVDRGAASAALTGLAERMGLSIQATALGVLRVADAAMARAVQRVSVQRGRDARAYTLVAFGGAGGLHACRLAELLGMSRVLVPVHGGLLSALGMLAAPPRYSFSQAVLARFDATDRAVLDRPAVRAAIDRLTQQGRAALDRDGIPAGQQALGASLDLRFAGQSYELTIPLDDSSRVIDCFIDEHRRRYGYAPEGQPVELVAARLEALGPTPSLSLAPPEQSDTAAHASPPTHDHASEAKQHRLSRLHRETLQPGERHIGPLIVEEYAATTVVPEGWRLQVLLDGQLLIQSGEQRDD